MKLFDEFEAVRFPEENLIFITRSGFIYYIYEIGHKHRGSENWGYKGWRKHRNAGNDHITVKNYSDINREELTEAMGGMYPEKETDFMRLCHPSQLCIRDMLYLLDEDFPNYMSDRTINHSVHRFLLRSDICYKSFLKLNELFNNAIAHCQDKEHVLNLIKELSFSVIGKDIFKKEIRIVDGHDSSSFFWIMPVRIIDYSDSDSIDSVAEMGSVEISIEENDVDQYLTPFLYKYFDEDLEANKNRPDASGFDWNLTYNFSTYESVEKILKDIRSTIDVWNSGGENEFTGKLREKRGWATYTLLYAKDLSEEQVKEYNASRPTTDDTIIELIIDFFNRFIYRMEYMMKVGKENGYDLISFMGP